MDKETMDIIKKYARLREEIDKKNSNVIDYKDLMNDIEFRFERNELQDNDLVVYEGLLEWYENEISEIEVDNE